MAVDHRKTNNRVAANQQEKLLQQQLDYLHDLTAYAGFIKEYVEKQKEVKGSTDQAGGNIKPPPPTASKEDVGIINAISSLVGSIDKVDAGKFGKNIEVVKGVTGLINEIVEKLHVGSGEEMKTKMAAMDTISKFSSSIVNLGDNILKAAFKMRIARPFVGMIVGTINQIVKKIGTRADIEESKNAAETVGIISKAIFNLSWKVVLAAPLLILAAPAMLLFKGIVMLANWTFKHVDIPSIEKGTKATEKMGLSLVIFAGSIVAAALIISHLGGGGGHMAGSLLTLFLSLAATMLIFKYLGNDGGKLAKGALGLLVISGSLAIFALSLVFSSMLIAGNGLAIIATILAVAAFALVFSIMGKNAMNIALGALAVTVIGFSLLFLSMGLVPLITLFAANPIASAISMLALPIGLIALGLAYAFIGTPEIAVFALLGAVVIAAIGGSLWIMGKALQAMLNLPMITKELADGWYMGITSIFRAFGSIGLWDIAKTTLAMPAMIGMAMALPMLADGVGKWKNVAGTWNQSDADSLTYTIQSLTKAYATAAGGNPIAQMKVFGFSIMESDVETGIRTTMKMGQNLNLLADGIGKWQKLAITPSDMDTIGSNITMVLTTLPNIFADIGKRDNGSEMSRKGISITKMLFGADFSKGDVERGIASTMKMGQNLVNLADGVFAWSSKGKLGNTAKEIPAIERNITHVMNTIPFVFASIGQRDAQGMSKNPSMMKAIFGADFSKGDVERGIDSTEKLGKLLVNLADGVFAWSSQGRMGKIAAAELPSITKNIATVLGALPQGFATVGEQVGTIFKSDMEKGIKAINKLIPTLNSVNALVTAFHNMNADGKSSSEAIGKDIGLGIQWIFYGINKASAYTRGVSLGGMSNGINMMAVSINMLGNSSKASYVELKKLIDLTDPLTNFMKLFVEFTKNLKEQQMAINAMQLQNLVAYSGLIDRLADFGKIDVNTFKENTDYILGKKMEVPSDRITGPRPIVFTSPAPAPTTEVAKNKKGDIIDRMTANNKKEADMHQFMEQIATALSGMAQLLAVSTPDAVADAIVKKLNQNTSPLLVKMKDKIG